MQSEVLITKLSQQIFWSWSKVFISTRDKSLSAMYYLHLWNISPCCRCVSIVINSLMFCCCCRAVVCW